MKTKSVICENCGVQFKKVSREVTRSLKIGRQQFCSRSCAGKSVGNIEHLSRINPLDASHLKSYNRRDEFTGFREHLRRARSRYKEFDLTLNDLKEVFDAQNGICPYSKVKLNFASKSSKNNPIYTMSLDRIDSNIGYIKENIQFISIAMNHLKNNMIELEVQELLQIIRNH